MVGIIFLTFGALNALLALTIETCTQGSADSLYGGFLTLFLYVAGSAALVTRPPSRWGFLTLLPACLIAVWHSVFALRFAWGYMVDDMSACYAMNGGFTPDDAGEWMDGGEPLLVVLWLAISAVFWLPVAATIRRRFRALPHS